MVWGLVIVRAFPSPHHLVRAVLPEYGVVISDL